MKSTLNNREITKLLTYTRKISKPGKCTKCGAEIKQGELFYSTFGNKAKYDCCKKCVGLFMSRYSYTFQVPKPDEETLEWKSKYDNEIKDKTGINIEGFAFGE